MPENRQAVQTQRPAPCLRKSSHDRPPFLRDEQKSGNDRVTVPLSYNQTLRRATRVRHGRKLHHQPATDFPSDRGLFPVCQSPARLPERLFPKRASLDGHPHLRSGTRFIGHPVPQNSAVRPPPPISPGIGETRPPKKNAGTFRTSPPNDKKNGTTE